MMSHSNYKNRKTLQLKEVSFMGASFLCGLIRIPDFVQNLFLNKKSYRLYIGIIYSSQKRREVKNGELYIKSDKLDSYLEEYSME